MRHQEPGRRDVVTRLTKDSLKPFRQEAIGTMLKITLLMVFVIGIASLARAEDGSWADPRC